MRLFFAALCAILLITSGARAVTLEERLLVAALDQPRAWYAPDSAAAGALEREREYEDRILTIVKAVSEATVHVDRWGTARTIPVNWRWGRAALVAAVLTHWYEESKFALEVHAGEKHPVWTQDIGKATCLGQLHVGLVPGPDWKALAGTSLEATRRCALWTARALTRMALYCSTRGATFDDIVLGMFAGLGGRGCAPTVSARAKVMRFAKVWRAMHDREKLQRQSAITLRMRAEDRPLLARAQPSE